jgi:predicted nucleic acid-binding protein
MTKYIFDTNIFNRLVDERFHLSELPSDAEFVATHIQIDELNNTKDAERRARLFLKFAETAPTLLPTESFTIGVSRINHAKISKEDSLAEQIRNDLDGRNRGKSNNIQDALIAEVAAVNSFTLVTADEDLAQVAKKHGINCLFHSS